MAEMGQAEVEVRRPLQVWRALMDWVAFLLHIILQIVRGTPSVAQFVLSYMGLNRLPPLLASSSSSPSFKPLPLIELSLHDSSSPLAKARVSVDSCVGEDNGADDDHRIAKLTVVLDLDETLVCAYETSSLPAIVRDQAIDAGLKWFEMQCVSSAKDFEGKEKVNYVTVFERPGLQEFLEQISKFADLVLFTAGLEDYARPLVDRIDAGNRFSLRLYRPSTSRTEYREHVKDLSCLSKDLCRVVIVDNNPFSFLLQPLNGIPCLPFSAGQPYDDQLLEVLLPLLKDLSLQKDVRPVLYERFHMPEWYRMHGLPVSGSMVCQPMNSKRYTTSTKTSCKKKYLQRRLIIVDWLHKSHGKIKGRALRRRPRRGSFWWNISLGGVGGWLGLGVGEVCSIPFMA